MPLPSTGAISLNNVNQELGRASPYNQLISLNDAEVRALFEIPSGAIRLSDGYSKALSLVNATGGNEIYEVGNFRIHKFTSSGNFTVTKMDYSPAPLFVYLVTGGGGGANGSTWTYDGEEESPTALYAGWGGAGGYSRYFAVPQTSIAQNTWPLNAAHPVIIGAGGSGGINPTSGNTSQVLTSGFAVRYDAALGGIFPVSGGAAGLGANSVGRPAPTSGGNSGTQDTEYLIGYTGAGGGGGAISGAGAAGGVGSGGAGNGGVGGGTNGLPGAGANAAQGSGAGGSGGGGAQWGSDPNVGGSGGNGGAGCVIFKYQFKNFA